MNLSLAGGRELNSISADLAAMADVSDHMQQHSRVEGLTAAYISIILEIRK
jgi:hypothetical protein